MKPPRQSPHQVLRAAEEAAEAATVTLQDPGLRAAFERLQTQYLAAMRRSEPADRDGRETAYFMLRALDALARDLAQIISGAQIARSNYASAVHHHNESDLQ
jgi:hypothetical protein